MNYIQEILTFEHESEHVFDHDLTQKKLFSAPKIYTANGNLKKRWYVYFSYRNPETGKLERMKNIYGVANTYKTKEDRLSVLSSYRRKLLKLLKEGLNPFGDNTELINKRKDKAAPVVKKPETRETPKAEPESGESKLGLTEAVEFAIKIKEKQLEDTSKRGFVSVSRNFLKWVKEKYPDKNFVAEIDEKVVLEFLNETLMRTSSRTRNNYRTELNILFETLTENFKIKENFVKKIKVLRTKPQRNKTYSLKLQEDIFANLKKEDPILLLYIKFVAYNFLRPIEVCRLRIGDLNIEERTLQFKAKNSPLKTKIIPEIVLQELPDLSKMNKDWFLFTPEKIGGKWDTTEDNKRGYFTKRFNKMVKEPFGLGKNYTMYGFRHTFITKLYRNLEEEFSPFMAKSKLMQITGHSSMDALEKYLRNVDAQLPDDYSNLLK